MAAPGAAMRRPRVRAAALLGTLTFLVAARGLGARSFDLDESVSVMMARLPWRDFAHLVRTRESNMSLYSLLLRGWIHVASGEGGVRVLSAFAGALTVAIVVAFVGRLVDRRVASVSGLLLATNPVFIRYALDARGYALQLLLVVASTALFVTAVTRPSPTRWAAYGVTVVAAVYCGFLAVLVPAAHAVALLATPRVRVPWGRLVATGTGIVAAVSPLAFVIRSSNGHGIDWIAATRAGRVFVSLRHHSPRPLLLAVPVLALVAIAVLVTLVRRSGWSVDGDERPLAAPLLVSWAVVPVAAIAVLSYAYRPLVTERYLLISLPPALVLVAVGFVRIPWRVPAVGALAVIVGVGSVLSWRTAGESQGWHAAARALATEARPGDAVVFHAVYGRLPFEEYRRRFRRLDRLVPLLPGFAWGTHQAALDGDFTFDRPAVARAFARRHTVWLVLGQDAIDATSTRQEQVIIDGLVAAGLRERGVRRFTGVRIVRYDSVAAPVPAVARHRSASSSG